jgi:hypothetical protein
VPPLSVEALQLRVRAVLVTFDASRPDGAVGAEGMSWTLAGAVMDGSAWATAVTVTVDVEGRLAGATYNPLVEIVPTLASPPVVPFTCQVTPALLVFVTVAEKGAVAPSLTVAAVGLTVTAMVAGGLVLVLALPPPPPQAARIAQSNNRLPQRLGAMALDAETAE